MQAEVIRNLLRTRPFQPFVVHLPKGRTFAVVDHEFAMLSPDGDTLLAYDAKHCFSMIDVGHIASIEVGADVLNSQESGAMHKVSPDHMVDQDAVRKDLDR